ncbi:NAD(P)H-hydrate dehydratase [Bacillus hwajinpoensis]|uniref:Bifunctional NAD(P)H-hydrate repair enzyme n=1 Tax=Guptibacillus hwajinpoensis TaxID=208199 RepID=A0A845F4Y6_9BACL|nr:NAD(P)H-hydrate dehydratase [Pseudalkalibacillus hwajinpoensis]
MRIVSGEEMYEADRFAMEEIGIAGAMLMENAGKSLFEAMKSKLHKNVRMALLIGTGNNGGDGFVLGRYLKEHGYDVDLWLIPPHSKVKGDAKTHLAIFQNLTYTWKPYEDGKEFVESLPEYGVIIDCLLGLGLSGAVRQPYDDVIRQVNQTRATVLSVDLPSGIQANGGYKEECGPIRADFTYTIQCPKLGAFLYPDAEFYGELEIVDIGLPQAAFSSCDRALWQKSDVHRTLSDRSASSHKGSHGKGLVIGGSRGMVGAPIMTAKAAYRSGAGLIQVSVPEEILSMTAGAVVETIFQGYPSRNGFFSGEVPEDLAPFDGIAVGPGLGRQPGCKKIVEKMLATDSLLILDADALYHLAELKERLKAREAPTVLTPHPGEMARLTGLSIKEVQRKRFDISRAFAKEFGVYLVLKGPYTIVTAPDGSQYVNTTGNPALAKGGSGDVLTGMILAFVMHSASLQEGISNAVYLHGQSADTLVQTAHSTLDVLATDVIATIPTVLHSFLEQHHG